MKKKLITSSITLAIVGASTIIPLSSSVYADGNTTDMQSIENLMSNQNTEEWIKLPKAKLRILINDDYDYILKNINTGQEISDVVEVIDGSRTTLTADEATDKLNTTYNNEAESNISTRAYSIFSKTGTKQYVGSPRKITHDIKGPSKITYKQSIGTTVRHEFSSSVKGKSEEVEIEKKSGVSWAKSVTVEYTGSRDIPKGKIAYVAFKPYYTQVDGKIKEFNVHGQVVKTRTVYGRTPKKTSIGCDGLEYLAYK